MAIQILGKYIEQALSAAVYDKLDDGTFSARIPIGLKLGHSLPLIGNWDMNKEPTREPMDTV